MTASTDREMRPANPNEMVRLITSDLLIRVCVLVSLRLSGYMRLYLYIGKCCCNWQYNLLRKRQN
mgnify:FL=1